MKINRALGGHHHHGTALVHARDLKKFYALTAMRGKAIESMRTAEPLAQARGVQPFSQVHRTCSRACGAPWLHYCGLGTAGAAGLAGAAGVTGAPATGVSRIEVDDSGRPLSARMFRPR